MILKLSRSSLKKGSESNHYPLFFGKMTCYCLLTVALLGLVLGGVLGDIPADQVTFLPGLSTQPSFKHYSGYLKATGTRRLHYWFVESAGNPQTDALVVWMNGGPGCSSMDGMLNEHGPFLAATDGKTLVNNPYSWNTVANMLYLEAPAGVGYSYSTDKNYTTDDDQVSLDNYWALKYFIMHYPEFSKNKFFITGESYGGIYVPTLAARIVDDKDFNFKGFAVGNGLSDWGMNSNSIMFFGYYHGLWGEALWNQLMSACCKTNAALSCNFATTTNPKCAAAVLEAGHIINSLNIYNLYAECYKGPSDNMTRISPPSLHVLPYMREQMQVLLQKVPEGRLSVVPPCVDVRGITTYLNRGDVRKALHIPSSLPKWEICSGIVGSSYKMLYKNMRSQYLKVLATKNQKILIYNGDVDMACNFLGDQWFAESLDQKLVMNRTTWSYKAKDGSKQVAGFVKHFEDLVVVTVKGSGHMVPQDKPIPALTMFQRYIQGKRI
ncbi:Lysosomal protective protein [Lamellibrachia satsuma]|nr:Lysosomal protective protein [Lamellibrachia satsuma]